MIFVQGDPKRLSKVIFSDKPIFFKSAITQWLLGSLCRAVLVFWCFKSVKCEEFCLLKLFQYRAFASPYKAWTLRNTLRCTETLHTSINSSQTPFEKLPRHPPFISRQYDTLSDTIRHQKTQANAIWCQPERPHILQQPFWVSGDVFSCRLVSVVVLNCPEITGGGFWEHNDCVYVCLRGWKCLRVYHTW